LFRKVLVLVLNCIYVIASHFT